MEQGDRSQRAYRAGARIARERMANEAPADARALAEVEASDVVVVGGCYDRVERVLDAFAMPYTSLSGAQLGAVHLRPEQLLVVNCPGNLGRAEIARIEDFVAHGGSLFTTDWALRHVIEPGFPSTIAYNERPTRDDVVRVEIRDHDNPLLDGVMDGRDDPQWWLEGSSYPIKVLDHDRVKVLIASRDMEAKYGAAPIAVLFRHGAGEVLHMVSHYYLQRTELRSKRHGMAAASYAAEKGVAASPALLADMKDMFLGEVEAAGSSARLFANAVAHKKRKSETRSNAHG
ncbi:hypothetical protein BH18ACT15_BH18ACT15_10390 [soil metagenome]